MSMFVSIVICSFTRIDASKLHYYLINWLFIFLNDWRSNPYFWRKSPNHRSQSEQIKQFVHRILVSSKFDLDVDSPNVAATLPLFVTELQDPLNILLGHKVIIFQCLKENRWHFLGKTFLHNTGHQGSMHTYITNVQERAEVNMIS